MPHKVDQATLDKVADALGIAAQRFRDVNSLSDEEVLFGMAQAVGIIMATSPEEDMLKEIDKIMEQISIGFSRHAQKTNVVIGNFRDKKRDN